MSFAKGMSLVSFAVVVLWYIGGAFMVLAAMRTGTWWQWALVPFYVIAWVFYLWRACAWWGQHKGWPR